MVKSRKGIIGVEGGKGYVTGGKKKASVRKETVAFFATTPKISCATNQNTLPPHLLSQPYHEVEVCRGREVSEAKVTMGPFFDNCVDIIWRLLARERYVNFGIFPSANFIKTETGCKSGDTCLFPHCKADEQPQAEERLLPKKKRKWRQRRCGCCEKRITIGLCIKRLGCTRFSRNQRVSVKSDAESLECSSKSSIHQVHATSREYAGQERTIAWKNTSQKSSSGKSLRYKIRRSVQGRDWKTRAMCPKQGVGSFQKNKNKLKANDKATFFSLAEEWVLPSASAREPEEVWIWWVRKTNSAELETMRTSRSPTPVMTANGEVQIREEATEHVKELDLFVTVKFLEETSAVLSLEKLCEDHGFSYHSKKRSKYISSKMARELIAIDQTMYHLWFLEYRRVHPQLRLHLPRHHLHHRSQHRLIEIREQRRASGRPDAVECRHFQFVSSTSNEVASIRGTEFG